MRLTREERLSLLAVWDAMAREFRAECEGKRNVYDLARQSWQRLSLRLLGPSAAAGAYVIAYGQH